MKLINTIICFFKGHNSKKYFKAAGFGFGETYIGKACVRCHKVLDEKNGKVKKIY